MGCWPLRDKTCIVGVGETEYTRWGGIRRSEFRLACEAIIAAVRDAGLSIDDVDGFVTYSSDHTEPGLVAQALGVPRLRYVGLHPGGGNAACAVVHNAAMAVHTGAASVVVCYRAICQGQTGRFGLSFDTGSEIGGVKAFRVPYGVCSAVSLFALQAQRHMHEFGTTSAQMGLVAVASNHNAQRNPRAVMYGRPITLDAHQASRMISDPYRLYDCCLESDGACAVVVASADRACDLRRPAVYIKGAAQGSSRRDGMDYHARSDDDWVSGSFVDVARDLYAAAGISPADIDVAQIYENFTGQVLMALEDFDFCARGDGGPFVEAGSIAWPHGSLPLNTSGGNLAEGYIHGLELVVEGTRQMRGDSTCQVVGASLGLVAAAPSVPPSSALILSNVSG